MTDDARRAKEPVSALLAGPYGHPFHPILVTIPIGAWVCSIVFDLASFVADSPHAFVLGARWLIGIGVLGALAAGMVGFLDYVLIPSGTPAHRVAFTHLLLNLAVIAAYAVNFVWRLGEHRGHIEPGPFILSIVGLGALGVSGVLGGKLAYHYGVRVASDATQAEGFEVASPPRTAHSIDSERD